MQRVFGFIVILIYALYGAYISSLYIIVGDKGARPSADFYIFMIASLLIVFSNLGILIIQRVAKLDVKSMLLLFILYITIKIIIGANGGSIVEIVTLIKDIGMNFVVGFIAFSLLKSRAPILSGLMATPQSIKGIKRIAVTGTVLFIGFIFYILTVFMEISPLDFFSEFKMVTISNDYYQDFGDYMTIAYCCLIPLQIVYLKSSIRSCIIFYVFVLTMAVQAFMAFICLQAVDSNKSVAVIVLVSALAIYLGKPDGWLISRGRLTVSAIIGIPFLLLAMLLAYRYMPSLDTSQLRIFDYGESRSILTNSSIQSRWHIIDNYFMEQFMRNPIFGDISIRTYMHSTLLSVQTHLGFIGSLLLWSFLLMHVPHLYWHEGNEELKAIALPILFVAIISSFFTWGPLWFLMGALYEYTPEASKRRRITPFNRDEVDEYAT